MDGVGRHTHTIALLPHAVNAHAASPTVSNHHRISPGGVPSVPASQIIKHRANGNTQTTCGALDKAADPVLGRGESHFLPHVGSALSLGSEDKNSGSRRH